ncbi:MAG: Response regulator receiver protein [Magnetococcales bacterium]|nr:Response regulator receiver protein [Magnetococcales bacterium]HIJ85377.1 response regulator [Magnetococcales bacterium]
MLNLSTRWNVLIVDDIAANIKTLCAAFDGEHELFFANNGPEALVTARNQSLDLILLDIVMPGMTGLEVCRQLKQDANTRHVPVIFITSKDANDDIAEGLQLGAYYYLTRPIHRETLLAIAQAAVHHYSNHRILLERTRAAANTLKLLDKGFFSFQTLEEADYLAVMLSCPCKDRENIVVGLRELLFNAVEHGNLGITYEDKSHLADPVDWAEEVTRRLLLPENQQKKVCVAFERSGEEIRIRIRDQGHGFDWKPFLKFDPERMFHTHGRGIALASGISFKKVEFVGSGNEVIATAILDHNSVSCEHSDMA